MNSINIQSSEFTPKVLFDPSANKYEISGESRPENSGKFYEPIIQWLEQYASSLNGSSNIVFEFKFDYFNSSSAKYILDILKQLNNYHTKGVGIKIKWSFDALDEDMKESGEEFAKLINVPFEFIPIE